MTFIISISLGVLPAKSASDTVALKNQKYFYAYRYNKLSYLEYGALAAPEILDLEDDGYGEWCLRSYERDFDLKSKVMLKMQSINFKRKYACMFHLDLSRSVTRCLELLPILSRLSERLLSRDFDLFLCFLLADLSRSPKVHKILICFP